MSTDKAIIGLIHKNVFEMKHFLREYNPHYSSGDANNLINALKCQEIATIAMCHEDKGHINMTVKWILIKKITIGCNKKRKDQGKQETT